MKKILLSISLLALAYTASANVPVIKSDPKIEAQVEQTLKKLTLEEKIGQMMELVTDLFGANDKNGVFYIDEHKTDSILSRYKIGSILNAPNTCAPTAKQWEKYIAQIQKISMKRIGIPCVFGLDQNHGSTYTQGGTLFPQNINVAATFNREVARRSAEATAYETRAVSIPWTYSPTVISVVMPVGLASGRTLARIATSVQRWARRWSMVFRVRTQTTSTSITLPLQ